MSTSQIQAGNRPTLIRWRILAILALASFVSYVLRTNLSFAAPEIMQDLGLSEIEWGWVLAAFTAGYALFQIPGGVLGDRFGPRRILTLIAVTWAVLTLATCLVPGTGNRFPLSDHRIAVRGQIPGGRSARTDFPGNERQHRALVSARRLGLAAGSFKHGSDTGRRSGSHCTSAGHQRAWMADRFHVPGAAGHAD